MRAHVDFDNGHVPNAVNLSLVVDLTKEALARVAGPEDEVVFYCHGKYCWQLCKSRPQSKSALTPSFLQRRLFGEAVGADQALVPQQRVKSLPVRSRHDVIGPSGIRRARFQTYGRSTQ